MCLLLPHRPSVKERQPPPPATVMPSASSGTSPRPPPLQHLHAPTTTIDPCARPAAPCKAGCRGGEAGSPPIRRGGFDVRRPRGLSSGRRLFFGCLGGVAAAPLHPVELVPPRPPSGFATPATPDRGGYGRIHHHLPARSASTSISDAHLGRERWWS